MNKQSPPASTTEARYWLLGATALLLLLFTRLYLNLAPDLQQTEQAYASGKAILLKPGLQPDLLRQLLTTGTYYDDDRDIDLVVDSLTRHLNDNKPLSSLGAINKRDFAIRVPSAWELPIGGVDFQNRVRASRQRMGFDSVLYQRELKNPKTYPATVRAGSGDLQLSGTVTDARTKKPMDGVLVQLQQHRTSADQPNQRQYAPNKCRWRIYLYGFGRRFGV